ncbi:hypothetical protein JNB_02240 [Janibacter sp. HTCC2649]|nr:hypothetical protein JNB_02240 [Janibacter sp. HTCC2649]
MWRCSSDVSGDHGEYGRGMESSPLDHDRRETPTERLDRNWDELLQELRVTQTGVQLLAGFLLTLPFQRRFASITESQRTAYLVALASAIVATTLLVAPVSAHRLMFRRHAKHQLVGFADRAARVGLVTLSISIVSATYLIFDVVVGRGAALTAAAAAVVVFVVNWLVIPLVVRSRLPRLDS